MPASDQGLLPGSYTVIQRVLIFLTRSDQVLLLKGAPEKRIWANKYNGVGGHVKSGEDVLTAAYRELYEETGIDGAKLRLCGMINIDTGKPVGINLVVFHGEYSGGESPSSPDGIIQWISNETIPRIPCVEDIPILLQHVFKFRTNEKIFFGSYYYDQEENLITRFFGEEVCPN